MSGLQDVIPQLRTRLARYREIAGINEQNTKAGLIEPVLRALGWDVEDLEDVHREFKLKSTDNPVDYALMVMREPRLFIEAKSLGEKLDGWANQIMGYASVAGVEWVVLTDGDEYRIFNSHAAVPIEQKLFRVIRISDASPMVEATLDLLSKERMKENLIQTLWKAHFVDRQVAAAITGLFAGNGDAALVRLIRNRTPSLTPSEIKAALSRARLQVDFPAGTKTISPGPQPKKSAPSGSDQSEDSAGPLLLRQIIEAGLITPPLELEKMYKGHLLTAQVEADGTVRYAETAYNSPSLAASMARKSIIGAPPGRQYPHTNGWTFWRFRDTDGSMRDIDVLRQRLKLRSTES